MNLNSSKLTSLQKPENISAWQQDQLAKNHQNHQMFMQLNVSDLDPWAQFKLPEKRAIREFIPNFPMNQTKKMTNDYLRDQKIMKAKDLSK
jgi:hypothetical protein